MTTQGPGALRIKGQEISVRVLTGDPPEPIATLSSISSFNDDTAIKLIEDGFLGEVSNRFDEILDGYGGDFEMQLTTSGWVTWLQSIEARATRQDPTIVFNVVRTDLFPDGTSLIWVYEDVKWDAIPQKVGGREDRVKVTGKFKCSQRGILQDQI